MALNPPVMFLESSCTVVDYSRLGLREVFRSSFPKAEAFTLNPISPTSTEESPFFQVFNYFQAFRIPGSPSSSLSGKAVGGWAGVSYQGCT